VKPAAKNILPSLLSGTVSCMIARS
jgi:hypothetical protein